MVVDGLRCGLSEELVWGCEPAALDSESLPRCPPEPVTFLAVGVVVVVSDRATASSSMARKTMSDSLRFRHRIASIDDFPSARLRSK